MKFVSFTFDDGAVKSAYAASFILAPFKATFYITTGWVKPNDTTINDRFNQKLDHGQIEDWKNLAISGFDIGSHTVSHVRADNQKIEVECIESLNFIKKIQRPPYSLSCPHNSLIKTNIYDTIRTGPGITTYNSLDNLNLFELHSYEPLDKDNEKDLQSIPNRTWTIFALHGIDEGFLPITKEQLQKLKLLCISNGFQIKSVREMAILYEMGEI